MNDDNRVLHGPIDRALLALAAPVIAAEALHIGFHLVDVMWVGRLGAWATAAIMTSMFSLWIALSMASLVTTGLMAQVSRAIGAGDRDRAGHAFAQAIWLACALSVGVAIIGSAGAAFLFRLVGTDAQVSAAGASYLRVIAYGMPFSFLYLTAGCVMRACGNTRTPMKVTGTSVIANAILAPFFIYGIGPFPQLGVPGSALATVMCMGGACAAYGVLMLRGHPDLPVRPASFRRPDPVMLGALVKVGAPYCLIGTLFSVVYLWYAHVASFFGDASIAILGIGNRLESITYLTADGFSIAAATFVGQNLGARNPERAEAGAWRAVRMMSALGFVLGVLFFVIPQPMLSVFTRDPETLRIGVPYLRILALCQIFTGLEGAIGGGFAGAGNTIPPMLVHAAFGIARVPLAYWAVFRLGLGYFGIAWTMSLTCVIRGCVLALWFRRGAWKTTALPGAHPLPASEEPEPKGI